MDCLVLFFGQARHVKIKYHLQISKQRDVFPCFYNKKIDTQQTSSTGSLRSNGGDGHAVVRDTIYNAITFLSLSWNTVTVAMVVSQCVFVWKVANNYYPLTLFPFVIRRYVNCLLHSANGKSFIKILWRFCATKVKFMWFCFIPW